MNKYIFHILIFLSILLGCDFHGVQPKTYVNERIDLLHLKDTMKIKADKILIDKFGLEFFESNIVFNNYGNTSIEKWKSFKHGTYWMTDKYLGDWEAQLKEKPNSYVLVYALKLGIDEFYNDLLTLKLDSTGNLNIQPDQFLINFEEIIVYNKSKLSINREKAINLCRKNRIDNIEVKEFESNLRFGWRKMSKYPGQYYYEVTSFINEETEGDCPGKCLIKKFYHVWRFNPWTSKIIEQDKMVQNTRISSGHGVTEEFKKIKE